MNSLDTIMAKILKDDCGRICTNKIELEIWKMLIKAININHQNERGHKNDK